MPTDQQKKNICSGSKFNSGGKARRKIRAAQNPDCQLA